MFPLPLDGFRRLRVVAFSACLLAAGGPLSAAPQVIPSPGPAPDEQQEMQAEGDTARVITTITVTAAPGPVKTELGTDVRTYPANASIIDPGSLERASAREPGEVLRGLSGVDFVYYGQGGIPSGPSVRGYTDRNFGQDMAGFLDGIPLNLFGFVASHGAMDLTPLFTTSIERVELVRGPLDARYGDFHRGGSVNFVTRDGVARPSALAGGSFGTGRAALTDGSYQPGAMGVSEGAETFALTGRELLTVVGLSGALLPRQDVTVDMVRADGTRTALVVTARLDSPVEVDYYRNGGILHTVLRKMLAG